MKPVEISKFWKADRSATWVVPTFRYAHSPLSRGEWGATNVYRRLSEIDIGGQPQPAAFLVDRISGREDGVRAAAIGFVHGIIGVEDVVDRRRQAECVRHLIRAADVEQLVTAEVAERALGPNVAKIKRWADAAAYS